MKRFLCLLLSLVLLAGVLPASVSAGTNPVPKASQAVVFIDSGIEYDNGRPYALNGKTYSTGTGFGVGPAGKDARIFATNCHVVSDEAGRRYDSVFIQVDGSDIMDESTVVRCEILYADPDVDLAIIKAAKPIPGVTTLPIVSAENIPQGSTVYALGFPGIADEMADSNDYTVRDITVTDGVVSRHLRSDGVKCMAHTANINHGNSGGPLINERGQVIGINTFGKSEITINETETNVDARYYAIYADYIMEAMDELGLPYVKGDKQAAAPALLAVGGVLLAAVLAAAIFLWVRTRASRKRPGTLPAAPAITVRAVRGPLAGLSWQLQSTLSFGRDPTQSIVLPQDTRGVSRSHCVITRQGNSAVVTDLNSSYGTFLNGRRLMPNQPTPLAPNSVISLASDAIAFLVTFA